MICGCEIWISAFTMHCELNEWGSRHKEKLISDYEISHSKYPEKRKKMNTLMKYIQMVLTDMKEQVIQKSLSNVEILIHTPTLL